MWVATSWSDGAAIATIVTLTFGGIYAVVRLARVFLGNEIDDRVTPKLEDLADKIQSVSDETKSLRNEVLDHMRTEQEQQTDTLAVIEKGFTHLASELTRELGQMQWRHGDPPEVVQDKG